MKQSRTTGLLVTVSWLAAAGFTGRAIPGPELPFLAWSRLSNEPLISPQGTAWEAAGTFNPAVVLHDGKFIMLYRAQDAAGTSRLGYAVSTDGIHFTRRQEPVLVPETEYEKDGGVEDP